MNAVTAGLRVVVELLGSRWRFRRLRGAAWRAYQHERAEAAASAALQHSAFYRRRAAGAPASSWASWPTVDKAAMMADFDEYNIVNVTKAAATAHALLAEETRDFAPKLDGITVGLSSGTSGHRTISLLTDRELYGFVGFMLGRMLDGVPLMRLRVAFFMRANSNAYEASGSALVRFQYFDLNLDDDALVARLTALDPNVLLGPPAMLEVIARLQTAGRLALRPRLVFSVAEVLEPQVRARVAGAFGVGVREVYHTSEGLLGVSCRAGRLHIPEDVSLVELERLGSDESGDGEERAELPRYTPIVTQLHRFALPFIRYRMHDVITLDERPCPCGSALRVIARVEGRCDDVFELHGAQGQVARVFPDTVRQAILGVDGVREYRARQTGPRAIEIEVDVELDAGVASGAALDAVRAAVRGRVDATSALGVTVAVAVGVAPEPDKRKKLARVRRLWRGPPTPQSERTAA